jgi:hypothetical protein
LSFPGKTEVNHKTLGTKASVALRFKRAVSWIRRREVTHWNTIFVAGGGGGSSSSSISGGCIVVVVVAAAVVVVVVVVVVV